MAATVTWNDPMLLSILTWYVALQSLALAGLPVAFATLKRLPSRGYATAKALGLLLTGVIFWWGGILRLWPNTGSAALAAGGIVLVVGLLLMRGQWGDVRPWWIAHRRYVAVVEVLFLAALVGWAWVRSTQPELQTAGGEKWMEIAFLNANLRAPTMPPQDPWLSGFAISYYYLGYLLLALVTRLTGIVSTIAFNLGNAGWYALVAVQAYSIVYDMLPRKHPEEGGYGVLRPLLAPLMLLVTGNGEGLLEVLHARGLLPAAFWRWLDIGALSEAPQPPFSWVPQRFFWWWQASRTLRDTTPWGDPQEIIDEFPAFSFILGDMHPHLLALPFVLVAVALALHAYRAAINTPWLTTPLPNDERARGSQKLLRRWAPHWAGLSPREVPRAVATRLGGYAIVLGALGFLNTWDFPIYWALLVGAWVLGRYAQVEKSPAAFFDTLLKTIPEAAVLGVLSVVCYLPFWIALRSQAGGILPNLFNATRPQQFAVMFLPLGIPVTGLVLTAARRRGIRWYQAVGLGVAVMVGIALIGLLVGSVAAYPYLMVILRGESVQGYALPPETAMAALWRRLADPWTGLLLATGVGAVLLALIRANRNRHSGQEAGESEVAISPEPLPLSDTFPLLLAILGLLLTLAPEFVYLKDVFMTRMNTIFKFYFQAWVLWSLAGAWQIARWLGPTRRAGARPVWRWIGVTTSAVLIAVGLVYTVLAIPERGREQGLPGTLDGAAWLQTTHPEDSEAIAWLNANVEGTPVIVEAPGDQHRAYIYEGRVSALTGLPTILGWSGHELQWRGNYDEPARREADLELLFASQNPDVVRAILSRYDVRYIYIGPTERQRYPAEELAKFGDMFPAVYDQDGVVIYFVSENV